jgi:hypothetical protein
VLPIVAVQVAPGEVPPALEDLLLRACSAGLERARCVSARSVSSGAGGSDAPRGIAIVSWVDAEHASIEVGLSNGEQPSWVSRELAFDTSDPQSERWRAVGFTIALLADDPRFWTPPPPAAALDAPVSAASAPPPSGAQPLAELRALTGAGMVSGPWRWGAELRLGLPISAPFFATGSVDYSLGRDGSLDARWFDASLGVGIFAGSIFAGLDGRLRLELLAENVAVSARREGRSDRQSAWVPGVSFGADLLWPLGDPWLLSAGADVFWLDGSTTVVSAGQRLGASAGAGVLFGLGAGCHF